jgi:hypothetical protein
MSRKQEHAVTEQNGDTYKYFLFEDFLPVRATFNKDGLKLGAQVPDAEAQQLVFRTTLLSAMDREGFFDEIDKAAFDRLCDQEYSKNKPAPDPPAK